MGENGYAKPVLVKTEWVIEHTDDPNVVVATNSPSSPRSTRTRRCTTRVTFPAPYVCTGGMTFRIRSSET